MTMVLAAGHAAREVTGTRDFLDCSLNNRWVACSVEKAKEYEQKHHVLHPRKEAALWSYRAAIEFEQKHQMVNRSLRGINRVGSKEVCCQEARWLIVMPGIQQSDKDMDVPLYWIAAMSPFEVQARFDFFLMRRLEVADKPQRRDTVYNDSRIRT
jgi:hypothetical protein